MHGDGLPPLANLLAVVDVEHAGFAEEVTRRLPGRIDESADLDFLVHGYCDVLEDGRVRDDVLVDDALGHARAQGLEVELERAPRALEQCWMELTEPTSLG